MSEFITIDDLRRINRPQLVEIAQRGIDWTGKSDKLEKVTHMKKPYRKVAGLQDLIVTSKVKKKYLPTKESIALEETTAAEAPPAAKKITVKKIPKIIPKKNLEKKQEEVQKEKKIMKKKEKEEEKEEEETAAEAPTSRRKEESSPQPFPLISGTEELKNYPEGEEERHEESENEEPSSSSAHLPKTELPITDLHPEFLSDAKKQIKEEEEKSRARKRSEQNLRRKIREEERKNMGEETVFAIEQSKRKAHRKIDVLNDAEKLEEEDSEGDRGIPHSSSYKNRPKSRGTISAKQLAKLYRQALEQMEGDGKKYQAIDSSGETIFSGSTKPEFDSALKTYLQTQIDAGMSLSDLRNMPLSMVRAGKRDGVPAYTGFLVNILDNLKPSYDEEKAIMYDLQTMMDRGITSEDAGILAQRVIEAKMKRFDKNKRQFKSRDISREMLPQYQATYDQLKGQRTVRA